MAYSLKTAWLRERKMGAQMVEVNIANIRMRTLFKDYKSGFIVLTNPALTKIQQLDFKTLQTLEVPIGNLTFAAWLSSLGNLALPTTEYIPLEKKSNQHVTLIDAWAMGLDIQAVHDSYHPDREVDTLLKTSLWINSTQEALSEKRDRFCVAVNGLLHRKEKLEDGIRVKSGRRTLNHSGFEIASLMSFNDVGKIQEISFKDDMINPSSGVEMYRSVLLELGVSLDKKSVLFSLGGVLHGEHDIVHVVDRDSGIIKLDLFKLDLFKLIQMLQHLIDIRELDLNLPEPYTQSILKQRLQLERVIRALLKMDQTFAIIVDAETLDVTYDYPLDLELYGKYNDERNFKELLVDPYGRLMPYRKFREGNIIAYAVGIDHYEFPADKRALEDQVPFTNSGPWWGDKLRTWARFMKIAKG